MNEYEGERKYTKGKYLLQLIALKKIIQSKKFSI